MPQRMSEMPPGTIGFEAIGEVDDDDWEQAVEPVLRREIAGGRKVRLLYLLGVRCENWRVPRGVAVHDLPAAKAWLADGIDG